MPKAKTSRAKGEGSRPTVAVIGSGVSGLTTAYVMRTSHDVTLFEADSRLGGHAHTHDVRTSDGETLPIDSGFIVHNTRTYPNLLRLFRELDIETRPTEMSMSVVCQGCGLEYVGARGFRGLFAQKRRLVDPRFLRTIVEVPRFHRRARALLASGDPEDLTWGEFLERGRFSEYFVRHFAVPLVSCVWSSGDEDTRAYPAAHLFRFLDHHGMLRVAGSPPWYTVVGGSRTYVERLVATLSDVRAGTPVTAVTRRADGVEVRTADKKSSRFDKAVIATHADTALEILADATPSERADLAAVTYSENHTWLHTDGSVLPRLAPARGSWNYRKDACDAEQRRVLVSYWMNNLHRVEAPDDFIVTLNAEGRVDPGKVIAKMTYHHPIFTLEAVAAAARLREAGGERLAFAGAHLGWGFHEDGCKSGVDAARRLGVTW
ncbi:MAG: FAD-dependent oxidoreductase [Demequinaceae bacterium]|nr:FAD-dependent oxidoreductase [Demequinaceae bacterium]